MDNEKIINESDLASVALALPDLPPPAVEADEDHDDPFFAQELNRLTFDERNEVLNDLHGVSDVNNENPEYVGKAISVLLEALDRIPMTEKTAYLIALNQNSSYAHDEKFLLMFLRADRFNVDAAALRVTAFFENKMQLFGREKLGREILYSDLTPDDIAVLESGYAQISPGRDRAGRAILCLMPTMYKIKKLQSKMRAIYMVLMFALKDEATQKLGMVGLAYNVGRDHTTDREAVWKAAKLVSIIPLRFTGVHYCYDDEKIRMLFGVAMYVFNKNARVRCRLHFGTHMECIYTLMTFGINASDLPVSPTGEKRLDNHNEYLRKMRQYENLRNDGIERIIVPGTLDVLLGRGKPLQKHNGNLNYHYVVEGYHAQYEQASKLEKTQIAKTIVDKIHEQGGRFLKQEDAGWVEIDDEASRTKISHTFRNHRIAARTALKKAAAAAQVTNTAHPAVDHRRRLPEVVQSNSSHGGYNIFGFADQKRRRVDV